MPADFIVIDDISLLPATTEIAEALHRVADAAYEKRSSGWPCISIQRPVPATTSTTTTHTGPTAPSTSDRQYNSRRHPTPTLTSSKSLDRPDVTDSSTSTDTLPDQPRHSFRHPQGQQLDGSG